MKKTIVAASVLFTVACSSKKSERPAIFNNQNPTYREKRIAAIDSLASGATDAIDQFVIDATTLEGATAAWGGDPDRIEDARDAFDVAARSWAIVEAWEVGPIADSTAPGGSELSDEIYSWPTANGCRVDQELVNRAYDNTTTFDALLVNARGLDAIERLLWHDGDNACPPQTDINAEGTWDEVTDLDIRRADYAAVAAADVVSHATELKSAFLAFAEQTETIPNVLFPNEQEALNVFSGALFFIDLVLKDLKLGLPLGIAGCASDLCLTDVEYGASQNSLRGILANLRSFESQFFGEKRYATLLDEIDARDIAQAIRDELDAAVAIASRETTLEQLATDDPDAATALYDHVKAINDRLKTDFVGVLDLELPQRAEGDND